MNGWLQLADITLHSGRRSSFKVEADDLTDDEVAAACALLAKAVPPFGAVSGVPTGGTRIEEAMRSYVTRGPLLIVDDVWTTGGSVQAHMDRLASEGVPGYPRNVGVLFARGPVPPHVTALWTLHESLWNA